MKAGSQVPILQIGGNVNTHFLNRDIQLMDGVNLIFEGATSNANETTLTVTDPTADRTITLPDASGTVALTSDITGGASKGFAVAMAIAL